MRLININALVALLLISLSGLAHAAMTRTQTREQIAILNDPESSDRDRSEAVSQLRYYINDRDSTAVSEAHAALYAIANDSSRPLRLRNDALEGAAIHARGDDRQTTRDLVVSFIRDGDYSQGNSGQGALASMMRYEERRGQNTTGETVVQILRQAREAGQTLNNEEDFIASLNYGDYDQGIEEVLQRATSSNSQIAGAAFNALKSMDLPERNSTERRARTEMRDRVRETLLGIVRNRDRDSRIRSNAFSTLSQRASNSIGDRQIVFDLAAEYQAAEEAKGGDIYEVDGEESYQAELLNALAWTGLTTVRQGGQTVDIRQMIYNSVQHHSPTMQIAGLEAMERNSDYYGNIGAFEPLIGALESSNPAVRSKALDVAIHYADDTLFNRLNTEQKQRYLAAMVNGLRSTNRSERARVAEKLIEFLLPHIRRSSNRESLMEAISNCIQFQSSQETVTGEEVRDVTTGIGVVLPVPFLFMAIFGDFKDRDYERIDVNDMPQFDDEDVAAFQSIINMVIQ